MRTGPRNGHRGDGTRETPKKRAAFETYLYLGPERSIPLVAEYLELDERSVYKWARLFRWRERAEEWDAMPDGEKVIPQEVDMALGEGVEKPPPSQNAVATVPVGSDVDRAGVRAMIDHLQGVIDRSLEYMSEQKLTVHSPELLTKLTKEYREMVDLYHKLTVAVDKGPRDKKGKLAENMNVFLGNMTQEERIAFITGGGTGKVQPVGRGAGGSPGRVTDADYTEIPREDGAVGRGREGVSGGAAGAEGGDEG